MDTFVQSKIPQGSAGILLDIYLTGVKYEIFSKRLNCKLDIKRHKEQDIEFTKQNVHTSFNQSHFCRIFTVLNRFFLVLLTVKA